MNREIVPAILVKTYQQFVRSLRLVEPYVKTVHLDVMDGKFVNNTTFADAARIGRLKHKLRIGVHMMVLNPQDYIEIWAKAGAFRYIFHAESVHSEKDFDKLIEEIKSKGMEAGVAINPETSIEAIKKYLDKLDLVLVMGVKPGWGGQIFDLKALEKISHLKKFRPQILVGVDGGVDLKNASEIIKSGADFLVAGTAIYKSKDIPKTTEEFKTLLTSKD